jgi:peptide/nickel transport system substrate-binding protein
MHYYGDKSLYDYDNNMFGFKKGDLSIVKSKTTTPMGAGAYKFVSYENGVITFEANESYWEGAPKTKYILFQECADGDKLAGVVSGSFDLTDPSFSTDVVDSIKGYNSNGELTGDVITTNTVDNLGYGYIGINAENVKVGDDSASTASKDLRKAFATLFAVYRDTVINSYYGDRASVIQYPISNTSWAAPKPADEGYQIAYSTDVDGNPIYTDSMTEQERCDAALQAAIGFLKAAGYTWDDASGKFTAAPAGAEMSYEVIIPGDGTGDHPSYGILTAAKDALATVGITIEINDPSDSNELWNALEAVPCEGEMWAAAWQATPDPDMYQVYYSSNINGAGGTDSNHYYITDDELDELIMAARESADQSYRKATYKQCLEIILDWAVEIPVYQRQNAFIFSTERVNMDTVTPDITTFWDWMNDIQNIEVK